MQKLNIEQNSLVELTLEDCQNIEGGSEFSESIFRTIGTVCKFLYYCATSERIRPSQYR